MEGASTVTIDQTAFIGNLSQYGGAIYSYGTGDNLTITNSRFCENEGPSIVRQWDDATLEISNSTFPETLILLWELIRIHLLLPSTTTSSGTILTERIFLEQNETPARLFPRPAVQRRMLQGRVSDKP